MSKLHTLYIAPIVVGLVVGLVLLLLGNVNGVFQFLNMPMPQIPPGADVKGPPPVGAAETKELKPPVKIRESEIRGKENTDWPLGFVKTEMPDGAGATSKLGPKNKVAVAIVKPTFTVLFDGNGLAEWMRDGKPADPSFLRKNKKVIQVGHPYHLVSRRDDFSDFHLRLEMRRNDSIHEVYGIPRIQVRMEDIFRGYNISFLTLRSSKKSSVALALSESRLEDLCRKEIGPQIAEGEWFTVYIVAKGGNLSVKVNGELTLDYQDNANRYRNGAIGLLGGDFRKIEIYELPVP